MTLFKVEELEAGPLLDQAVLLAMGAMRVLEPPAGVPDNVRERWPADGCLVLVEGSNMAFYGQPPPFSTDWGVGGPALIDKAGMSLLKDGDSSWMVGANATEVIDAFTSLSPRVYDESAALPALCRAFVLHKVGPTIEIRERSWNVGTPTVTQGPPR